MKLVFIDTNTNELVAKLTATRKNGKYFVNKKTAIYKNYDFMIDAALYCINEGKMTFGTYDSSDDKPLANWYLCEDCAFAYSTEDGYQVDFYDGQYITHDAHFKTWKELLQSCETYILAGLFDKEPFATAWENSSYNSANA